MARNYDITYVLSRNSAGGSQYSISGREPGTKKTPSLSVLASISGTMKIVSLARRTSNFNWTGNKGCTLEVLPTYMYVPRSQSTDVRLASETTMKMPAPSRRLPSEPGTKETSKRYQESFLELNQ